jgi:hypothetical protein
MDGLDHAGSGVFWLHRLMLAGMTVWEIKSPTILRKGFLPMETTRGDRLFIGLLSAAYVNLGFVGISGRLARVDEPETEPSIWISFVACPWRCSADHAQGLIFSNAASRLPLEPRHLQYRGQ